MTFEMLFNGMNTKMVYENNSVFDIIATSRGEA